VRYKWLLIFAKEGLVISATDPVDVAGGVTRDIRTGSREGQPTRILTARRWYAADRPDVWDALTDAERIPRWFLPITGELSVGGRYQFEGNAGGVIERCDEPDGFAVTWEYGGNVSWLEVRLGDADGGTTLELVHEAPVDPDLWGQFGPGAVGLGWDLGLLGLGLHLDSGAAIDPAEAAAWVIGAEGREFVRAAGEDWARAAVDAGDDPDQARAAAERSHAFYTTPPDAGMES
jgi:uncharacterized protein YndB with AHSA1/START domain